MKITYATISRKGNRLNNEDAYRVVDIEPEYRYLALICDGFSGHDMGEAASNTVADAIVSYWREHDESDSEKKVRNACQYAIGRLNQKADAMSHCQMGTTMVLASIEGEVLTIAHLGDSRCYFQRPPLGLLYQSRDHVRDCYDSEVIERCFFSYQRLHDKPDVVQFKLKIGDRILLISDGINKTLSPILIERQMIADKPLPVILNTYDLICDRQAFANYTAVLMEVD